MLVNERSKPLAIGLRHWPQSWRRAKCVNSLTDKYTLLKVIPRTAHQTSQLWAHLRVGGWFELYLKQGLEGVVDPGKPQV